MIGSERESHIIMTTIYHNPKCSTSRNTLAMIRNTGEEPAIILYLEAPPTKAQLQELLAKMQISPRGLLRTKADPYVSLGLKEDKFTDNQLIDYMVEHPILIERPVVVTSKGAVLCRPAERVLEILPNPQKGEFRKENGDLVVDSNGKCITPKV